MSDVINELRAALEQGERRVAALEQRRHEVTDDSTAFREVAAAIEHERLERERLTLLLQRAEGEQRSAEAEAKRAELAATASAFREGLAQLSDHADRYASALAGAWAARAAIDATVQQAAAQRERARSLAQELGEQLDLDDRPLPALARGLALAAMAPHSAGFVELRGWLNPPRTLDETVYVVREALSLPLHSGEPYPLEQQLEDMLSGRYLERLQALNEARRTYSNEYVRRREEAALSSPDREMIYDRDWMAPAQRSLENEGGDENGDESQETTQWT